MASLKVTVVLLLVNWVCLTSTLSEECLRNLDTGQNLSVIPVDITCATSPNGTLNTWWTVRDHVQLVTLDYNCTGFGEDRAENLHFWVEGSRGVPISEITDLRPNASSNSSDPTCYVDGCFVWNSGRGPYLTWIIPTVTCNLSTIKQTASSTTMWSTGVSSVAISRSVMYTTGTTKATTPRPVSGGLKSYMLFVLIVAPILVIVPFLILWKVKRKRKKQWWVYGTNRDKKVLLGNEPCIDPMDRVKNDYFETITIVDPLELPELQMTTILPVHVDNHFLQDFNQQAGDSEGHSFSDSGSSGNDDGSIRVESASGGEAENCSLSTCTHIIENSGDIEVQLSGSKEERLTNDDTGTTVHVRSTTLNLGHPPTRKELSLSNQIQVSNEVVSPSEPGEMVTTSTSTPGELASPQNKICCLSTDGSQRKLSCAEPSPIDSGLSMNEGSSVRPLTFCLHKNCSPSTDREELSHQNQIMNTEGASVRVRPTSLNLRINQIAMNSTTKEARVRPASLNLQIKCCPPPTERDEIPRPNQNSIALNIEGSANVRPTSLNLQKHCPPSTEKYPNQIQISNNIVASPPERARVIITTTSVHETLGQSASASGCATKLSDSLEISSSPVLEQVYKNVDSEEPDCHSHLETYDHAKEHLHCRQALQSKFDPLSIIPEETLSSRCEDQTRYPSYIISSSECTYTSSAYSSEQGTNCGVGYLADVEDMDSTSLQSDLESDEGTKGNVNGENRNECEPESIQEMMQRLLHLPNPPRMQWYNNSSPHQPHYLLSSSDDSDVGYFYIAVVPPFELPDSPHSTRGYICTHSQTVDVQDDEKTFGLEDEVMARPVEHTDTPNSGYISNDPQNEIHDDEHQYEHETTV